MPGYAFPPPRGNLDISWILPSGKEAFTTHQVQMCDAICGKMAICIHSDDQLTRQLHAHWSKLLIWEVAVCVHSSQLVTVRLGSVRGIHRPSWKPRKSTHTCKTHFIVDKGGGGAGASNTKSPSKEVNNYIMFCVCVVFQMKGSCWVFEMGRGGKKDTHANTICAEIN